MKDYTLKKEDKDKFILNYEIDDGEIIIKYADGREFKTKYSTELEKNILEIMKNQVLNGEKFCKKQKQRQILSLLFWLLLSAIIAILPTDKITFLASTDTLIAKFYAALFTSLISVYNFFDSKSKINDYNKNIDFINNSNLIFNDLNENIGLYTDVKKKTPEIISELITQIENTKTQEIKEPNLNTINDIEYVFLDEIYDCINKDKEVKSYVKKKTLKKD